MTDQTLRTLQYVDGVNFARRAHAPALWSTALMDQVCPPSTCYAAFNWYGDQQSSEVSKQMVVYPYNSHEGGGGHQVKQQLDWLAATLR